VPDWLPENRDAALARLQLTRHEFHERRFACTVGTEQPRNARRHSRRHVVEADDLSVPFRQVIGGDDVRDGRRFRSGVPTHETTSTPRTRRSSTTPETTRTMTIISRETGHGL